MTSARLREGTPYIRDEAYVQARTALEWQFWVSNVSPPSIWGHGGLLKAS